MTDDRETYCIIERNELHLILHQTIGLEGYIGLLD